MGTVSKLYVSNNTWIYVYIKKLQLRQVSWISTPIPTPTPESFNSNSNSNSGSFNSNSNSNSGKSFEYQLQLQLREFQLQLQLRQVSWVSTPTPTPEVSTPIPTPTPELELNPTPTPNSNSNSGVDPNPAHQACGSTHWCKNIQESSQYLHEPLKLMFIAGKITTGMCSAWKITHTLSARDNTYMPQTCGHALTHLPLCLIYTCVSELGQHWFR